MIYFLSIISSVISSLGIGGGAAFILLSTMLNLLDINEARAYNLILFVGVGIAIIIKKIKKEKFFSKEYFKTLLIIFLGCMLGYYFNGFISEKILKTIFYVFMIFIGGYEIFFCLKNRKTVKNNTRKEWLKLWNLLKVQ